MTSPCRPSEGRVDRADASAAVAQAGPEVPEVRVDRVEALARDQMVPRVVLQADRMTMRRVREAVRAMGLPEVLTAVLLLADPVGPVLAPAGLVGLMLLADRTVPVVLEAAPAALADHEDQVDPEGVVPSVLRRNHSLPNKSD
jgi:hypothetical protein